MSKKINALLLLIVLLLFHAGCTDLLVTKICYKECREICMAVDTSKVKECFKTCDKKCENRIKRNSILPQSPAGAGLVGGRRNK
jgi:hypothetical protein